MKIKWQPEIIPPEKMEKLNEVARFLIKKYYENKSLHQPPQRLMGWKWMDCEIKNEK